MKKFLAVLAVLASTATLAPPALLLWLMLAIHAEGQRQQGVRDEMNRRLDAIDAQQADIVKRNGEIIRKNGEIIDRMGKTNQCAVYSAVDYGPRMPYFSTLWDTADRKPELLHMPKEVKP